MKTKRINEIEKYVKENESATIDELSNEFDISINTVRRDINELEQRGTIEKVYGGVRAKKENLINFTQRSTSHAEEKRIIAEKAAAFIEENDVVFIDSGTTTIDILDFLDPKLRCTVITNSLDIIERVVSFPNITLFVVGSLFRKQTRSFVTMSAEKVVMHLNVNKAFMAATGVSIKNGVTNSSQEEYWIKKEVAETAAQVFVLVDNSKFDRAALLTYSSFDNVSYVLTDQEPPKEYSDYFKEKKIIVV
ncbi:DeoR/GlpR family DNA-binding transcription regulator [Enterococcus sp. HY326]|uniref:DeoR/GlpR family DNA-binding transcription regulator n=1 Tax=Enterococcus sp. HY326 TaxID=2971265 RepID=UPI002240DDC0|nr:DeoR/GlpR family DNA-binding transcription regulator [Enterococcus sp. HY326]